MQQRDYFKKQVDIMAKFLARLIDYLSGVKPDKHLDDVFEEIHQSLKEEIQFDLEVYLSLQKEEFMEKLEKDHDFTNMSLQQLADLFVKLADSRNKKDSRGLALYEKGLLINEYLKRTEQDYSFERHLKIERLRGIIL